MAEIKNEGIENCYGILPSNGYKLRLRIDGTQYETNFGNFFQWALKKYFDEHPEKVVKEERK